MPLATIEREPNKNNNFTINQTQPSYTRVPYNYPTQQRCVNSRQDIGSKKSYNPSRRVYFEYSDQNKHPFNIQRDLNQTGQSQQASIGSEKELRLPTFCCPICRTSEHEVKNFGKFVKFILLTEVGPFLLPTPQVKERKNSKTT